MRLAGEPADRPVVGCRSGFAEVGDAEVDLAAQLGEALARLVRVVGRAKLEASAGDAPIEFTAVRLLIVLAEAAPMRISALADAVFSDPSTVSRQVAALDAAGYLARVADPNDRRANLLRLTAAGHSALAEHRRLRDERIARVTAHWPVDDWRRIAVLVDRLAADFTAHLSAAQCLPGTPGPPAAQCPAGAPCPPPAQRSPGPEVVSRQPPQELS